MLQWRYRITKLFDVPAGAFRPVPAVVSAFVRMKPKDESEIDPVDFSVFSRVVTHAFTQRRKTLRNALSAILTEDAICSCGIDPSLRAETIPVKGFVALARCAAEQSHS
jgi:16S rRNA (adenine1518-N6/adenine1519-N6)-dimethyltransferase